MPCPAPRRVPGPVQGAVPRRPQVAPTDEGLRRPPPGHQIGRHAAPFRAVLMPPDNRLDCLTQGDWLRLATGSALIDQRLQNRPLIIIQDNSSALLSHPR